MSTVMRARECEGASCLVPHRLRAASCGRYRGDKLCVNAYVVRSLSAARGTFDLLVVQFVETWNMLPRSSRANESLPRDTCSYCPILLWKVSDTTCVCSFLSF